MNEIELVNQFAAARGLRLKGDLTRVSAREILLPLLILDVAYGYIRQLRPDDFRFQARRSAKRIHEAYNNINGWFFAGLKDQLEDAAIDLMDQLEESVKLDILVTETAVWNIMKFWPEPTCTRLVASYMTYLLAAGASVAWEHVFRSSEGYVTKNKATLTIQAEAKRLAGTMMAGGDSDAPARRVKELRDAEAVLGRKLVMWTRQTDET